MEKYGRTPEMRNENVPPNIFLMRQFYDPYTHELTPELKGVCYCNNILNPALITTKCKSCGVYLHYECVEKNKDQPCPVCNGKVAGKNNQLFPPTKRISSESSQKIDSSPGSVFY